MNPDTLKLLLGIDGYEEDSLLVHLMNTAQSMIDQYCNTHVKADDILVDIAVIMYNRRGSEGEKSRSEGGISRSFDDILSDGIKKRLNQHRIVRW